MSLAFPASPAANQVYQSWIFQNGAWQPNLAAQLVTSFNGRSGAVSFAPADNTTGQRVLISRQTVAAAVATINFPNVFSAAYNDYEIEWIEAELSAAGGFYGRTGNNQYDAAANYSYCGMYTNSVGGAIAGFNSGSAGALLGQMTSVQDAVANFASNGRIRVFGANQTNMYKYFIFDTNTQSSANGIMRAAGVFHYVQLVAITHFQFITGAGGNFTAGRFEVYGIVP